MRFWLYAEKIYKPVVYEVGTGQYVENENLFEEKYMVEVKKKISKQRFAGYMYNGGLYLDNPGFPIKERDVWVAWKRKGLIT